MKPSKSMSGANPLKSKTKHKEAHTDNTRFGMGDFYGSGVKAPMGKMRGDSVGYRPVSKKELGKPPKTLA